MDRVLKIVILAGCALAVGCAEPADREDRVSGDAAVAAADVTTARVQIVSPADGEVLDRDDIVVRLQVEGLAVVPAGVEQASSGHHHLLVDAPLPDLDLPIPSESGRYIHLGKGQTEYLLEGLDVGEHRVIALVGDHVHVPLSPPVADTVRFLVR